MVLIDASTRWSCVCLLFSHNPAFEILIAQLIYLREHFLDYPIKKIWIDNTGEFTLQAFNDYYMLIGITIKYHVAHLHTQNGLDESLTKHLQLRPLQMHSKFPTLT